MHDSELRPGDLVTDSTGNHAMVLSVVLDQEQLRVTRGSAHESELVNREDVSRLPWMGGHELHGRLAFSIDQVTKILAEKDRWAEDRIDALNQEVQGVLDRAQDAELKIQDIRKWMISRYESGDLHRSDLDTFLAEFGLEPYARRWTGKMTIIVSLTVDDARTKDAAVDQAYGWAETSLEDGNADISCPSITKVSFDLVEDLT